MERLKLLIGKLKEQYQDIEYKGEKLRGLRDCETRWDLVQGFLPEGVFLDLGSAQGYYSSRVSDNRNNLVLSFEVEKSSCELQSLIFENRKNVIVLNHLLTETDLEKWVKAVECIDVVLAFSVLHHYKHPKRVIQLLSELSPRLIVEIPTKEEITATGQEAIREFWDEVDLNSFYNKVVQIGEVESHTDPKLKRPIFYCENKLTKHGLEAYFGSSDFTEARHKVEFDGEFLIDGKPIIKGVNAFNLTYFNPTYPRSSWWAKEAYNAYFPFKDKDDIRPWNLLYTSTGLVAIDSKPRVGMPITYYEGDLTKIQKSFELMNPEEIRKLYV